MRQFPISILRRLGCALLVVTAAACGSSNSPAAPTAPSGTTAPTSPAPPTGATNGTFSATIDGVAWAAAGTIAVTYNNGSLSMAGGDGRQTFALSVNVNRGPGTYTAGVIDPQNVVVATLTPSGSASQWIISPTFGSGSVTLTSLTSTTASGTFSLTMAPSAGTGAAGNKTVTNGIFNVTFTGSGTLPPNAGNVNGTLTAQVDGAAWRGTVSARASVSGGLLSVSGQDTDTRLITFAVPATVGSHALGLGVAGAIANMILGAQQWTTAAANGSGTVVITSLTGTRVTGTFTLTLQPAATNTAPRNPVQVTNGQFDLAF